MMFLYSGCRFFAVFVSTVLIILGGNGGAPVVALSLSDDNKSESTRSETRWLRPTCGDGKCQGQESCSNCPQDCGSCPTTEPPPPPPTATTTTTEPPPPTTTTTTTATPPSGSSFCFGDQTLPCTVDADCGTLCDRGRDGGNACVTDNDCFGNNAQCTVTVASCQQATPPTTTTTAPPPPSCDRSPIQVIVSSATEIANALGSCGGQPGDVLIMADGTWTNQIIQFIGTGTAQAPVTLRAQTPGLVILNGNSRLQMAGEYLVVDGLRFEGGTLTTAQKVIEFRTSASSLASFSRLTHTAVLNYNPSQPSTDYDWIGLYGTNNRVDHCMFLGKNHKGPLLVVWRPTENADFHQIDHNYFADFASGSGENEWETIRMGTSGTSLSDSSCIVESNLFQRCNGEIEIISVKSGNNTLRGNTFESCQGMLTLRHGRGNRVEGNFFLGNGVANSGGIRIIDSDHVVINNYLEGLTGTSARAALVLANGIPNSALNGYFAVLRATVAFNTVYNCREALRIGWRSSSNSEKVQDSVIANNAIQSFRLSSTDTRSIIVQEDAPLNLAYEGNYIYGLDMNLGIPANAGITESDPLLARASDTLMRPETSVRSPLINGAVGMYDDIAVDMDGQARPVGGAKDVGADEVSTGSATRRSLSTADVGSVIGPSWWP